jgi:ADP-ribosylglycohydrolase
MTADGRMRSLTYASLAGLAIGDALGAPVEHMTAEDIATRYPNGVRDFVASEGSALSPGQGTDDTEMAFLVARSLVERQGLDMADVAARLVTWAADGGVTGPSTSQGIAALVRGSEWSRAGGLDSPSSGCLPRCTPIALAMPEHRLVDATLDCCKPTHRHPLALAASVVQNLILSCLIAGAEWSEAITLACTANLKLEGISVVQTTLEEGPTGGLGAVDVLAEAVASVSEATSTEEAIIAAVAAGGDTDTRAATSGSLAGARWGHAALPERWIEGCEATDEERRSGEQLADLRVKLRRR